VRDSVELLWFVQERDTGEDTELLIGVYETEEEVRAAVERLRSKPGFASFPQGFTAERYELNKDHWTEGFIRQ
jgi:hypothetical protein